MRNRITVLSLLAAVIVGLSVSVTFAQRRQSADTRELREHRNQLEAELQNIAVVERKVMVRMRDGKRMAADVYRPKDAAVKYPTIFSRTRTTSISGTSAPELPGICRASSKRSNADTPTL